jgi:hypothetical protein
MLAMANRSCRSSDAFIFRVVAQVLLPLLAAGRVLSAAQSTPQDEPRAFLSAALNLTSDEISRIAAGHVFARTIDASDKREVATVGIVRIAITPAFYVERLLDIANFKRDDAVLQIGTFGNPPDARDVAALTLDDSDIRSLRGCRVGNCGVQLSAEAIQRFRRDVDWNRADAPRQANALMREMLVEYVAKYRKSGVAAYMSYADQSERIDLAREFVALADSDSGGLRWFPNLHRHLFDYPVNEKADFTDLLYWSKERIAHKGVVSVTHLAISRTAGESFAEYAIASKHLYGTHYFDASLGLTILLRDRSTSASAMYLVYVNRSRLDVFNGLFGSITRKIVSSRARSTVSDQLARLQRTLERQFADSQAQ